MKQAKQFVPLALALALIGGAAEAAEPVRVAVVGGIVLSGVWGQLEPKLEAATGVPIELVLAAPKKQVVPAFASGKADLLVIHGGSETFALQARGLAGRLQTWGYNEHVIVGPKEDPAGVRGAPDGATAMARIAKAGGPFVASRDVGSHESVQRVLKAGGAPVSASWIILDESSGHHGELAYAAAHNAYVVAGAIPVAKGRLAGEGMETLFSGDPAMRRAFVTAEPGAAHPASAAARENAKKLVDYLVSPAGQADLAAADAAAGGPWIFGLADSLPPLTAAPGGGHGEGQGQGHGGH